MRQEVRWTDLTYEQIAEHLAEAGTPVSVPVVKQLLRKHGSVTRKAQKSKAMGGHPDRNQQFENIARLKQEYLASDNPIVSMDTKHKEFLGLWIAQTEGARVLALGAHRSAEPRRQGHLHCLCGWLERFARSH